MQNLTGRHPEERDLHGLPPEPVFLRLLRLERRRTERSRQPFVLMVLERERFAADDRGTGALERGVSALLSAIRETDVAGWYKDHCLGVILAEPGAKDKGAVIETLQTRMTEALRSRLVFRRSRPTGVTRGSWVSLYTPPPAAAPACASPFPAMNCLMNST